MDKAMVQRLVMLANNYTIFDMASGTLTQLNSTGALRLFANTKIPNLLSGYQQAALIIKQTEIQRIAYVTKVLEGFVSAHFTPENIFYSTTWKNMRDNETNYVPVNNSLRNFSQADATQFAVDLMLYKTYVMVMTMLYKTGIAWTTALTKGVTKEMHLKKE